jgi:hypothetical protein
MKRIICLVLFGLFLPALLISRSPEFILYAPGWNPAIVVGYDEDEIVKTVAGLLAEDMNRITGYMPPLLHEPDMTHSPLIIAGCIKSEIIRQLDDTGMICTESIRNRWEVFSFRFIHYPGSEQETLVISGSDNRGTAYGILHLSEIIGVSPWYWWDDIPPVRKDSLIIPLEEYTSKEPSVKYRGIFLNDEDWGLHPWASGTYEPETGDIGPKTYEKIFELLLRLKANTIWPAMHPRTGAFFRYPGNAEMARKYNIVIGTSHAEPMLRNNVGEWNSDSMGAFNYRSNREKVYQYWEERVIQAQHNEVIYTLGMRGIHDSGMEGYEDPEEKTKALEQIIADQRHILRDHLGADTAVIPQVFIPYKEVLDLYDNGLKLPDDVCILWTDDNYGYMRRLNSADEARRPGGSGIYYHISYWGRPHDYLWLSSTHPMLIWEELTKAWQANARKVWIVNAGDIKPGEYNLQLFLDMAYNMEEYTGPESAKDHLAAYLAKIFGDYSETIHNVLWEYYRLAFERRPEFMGWSQTEPSTPTQHTAYNPFCYGDEVQKRIDAYSVLENRAKEIMERMPQDRKDAFFHLVYYPVVCASLMNKKFLYADKAFYYGHLQNRLSARDYAAGSHQALEEIHEETEWYNHDLAGGKWDGMMNDAPRNLPVFQEAGIHLETNQTSEVWNCIPEGYVNEDSCLFNVSGTGFGLPVFTPSGRQRQFIDIFLTSEAEIYWKAEASDDWIILSDTSGILNNEPWKKEKRIWISLDWEKIRELHKYRGHIIIRADGKDKTIGITASACPVQKTNSLVESDGLVSVFAENYSRITGSPSLFWKKIESPCRSGCALVAMPYMNYAAIKREMGDDYPTVEYDFYTFGCPFCSALIACLPVHPLNNYNKLCLAVSLDNSPPSIIDFTTHGRSEEWKQNVLSNTAVRSVPFGDLRPGFHTLRITALDPGVILDHIVIDLGGLVSHYGIVKETRLRSIKN